MLLVKSYLGEENIADLKIKYYVVEKNTFYGIEIEEYHQDTIISEHELFTENKTAAIKLGIMMKNGKVTQCSMHSIIDDCIY
ncbi:MAG: DUF6514 family protein [Cellulosilyticaceae bacterium]